MNLVKLFMLCVALLPITMLNAQNKKSCKSTCNSNSSYSNNGQKFNETFTETIIKNLAFASSNSDNLLVIENVNGKIKVDGYNGNEVLVEAKRTIKAANNKNLELGKREANIGLFNSDQVVYFYLDSPYSVFDSSTGEFTFDNGNRSNSNLYSFNIEYVVKVPYSTNVRLNNISGPIVEVSNLSCKEIEIANVSGHLESSNLKANSISMTTVSGHVTADRLSTNSIDAKTVSGNISLNKITGQTDASTVSGNVTISYDENPINNSNYTSTSGNVKVSFQSSLDADVSCRVTMSGSIFSDFNELKQKQSGSSWNKINTKAQATIGTGGKDLNFQTGSGNIYLIQI